jgi:hypothetical protein
MSTMIRFMHIPKTGGTSFVELLHRQYVQGDALRFELGGGPLGYDVRRYAALERGERARIALFTGHAPIRTGIPEADSCPIITILREPVSRVRSFCQHVSEGKSPYLLGTFPPDHFDLDEFLGSGNRELCNLQARMLLSTGGCRSDEVIKSGSPEEVAARALDSLLNRIFAFGIQEFFDESVVLFADQLGWKKPWYRHLNVRNTGARLTFLPHQDERIRSLNAIDIGLYEAAKHVFLERITARSRLRKRLKALHWRNRVRYWQLRGTELARWPVEWH